jgi:transposase-like protein
VSKRRRQYDRAFKLTAIARMEGAESITALAAELGVRREMLHKWRLAYEEGGAEALLSIGRPSGGTRVLADAAEQAPLLAPERRVAELERLVGQQQRDLDFFRAALRQVREQRRRSGFSGVGASTP